MQISNILDAISSPLSIASLSTAGSSVKLGRTAPLPSTIRALYASSVATAHEPVSDFQGEARVRFSHTKTYRDSNPTVSYTQLGVAVATDVP